MASTGTIKGVRKGLGKVANIAKNPLQDLAAYPVLTEEVGYPPSPLAKPGSSTPGSGGSTSSLGQLVNKTITEVLGWKFKTDDSKGFVGALTQSFSLTEIEGHVESKWTPRTYVVQTDLGGGLSGAQASIYTRGKEAMNQALPLLDGLSALDPEADTEDVIALKAVVKSQITELVNELGFISGPRITRVNKYFQLLLIDSNSGIPFPPATGTALTVDPDSIGGTLGNLRDVLGLNFLTQDFVNSLGDEQDLSNFRILSDYITSLAQSWINNLPYLGLDTPRPFFGTQLVLLSRQLSVVAESVDEVRFVLDSVFIGPAERQTIEIRFPSHPSFKPIFLEDMLSWIHDFATNEGPQLIQDGGKFGVQNTVRPVVGQLTAMVADLPTSFSPANPLPAGFFTPRVRIAIEDLVDQLQALLKLARPIEHEITSEPDFGLPFQLISVEPISLLDPPPGTPPPGAPQQFTPVLVKGNGFQIGASVVFSRGTTTIPLSGPPQGVFFRSETTLQVNLPSVSSLSTYLGTWNVTVTNGDGQPLTLPGGFTIAP